MKRKALVALAIAIAAIGAVGIRVVHEGKRALADGDAAIADHRPRDAIAAWESAARWYFPGASHVDVAYARLRKLAETEHVYALAAWRAIRHAAHATRSLWQPHAADLAVADAEIAKIAAVDADAPGQDLVARLKYQQERLAVPTRPGIGPTVLASAGVLAWLVGIVLLVRRRRLHLAGIAMTIAGIVAWAAGLYSA